MALMSGERQVHSALGSVRKDHTARYYWANSFMRQGDRVLDAMCGIGYGSYIMAMSGRIQIHAFDADAETIEYAKTWYQLSNIQFNCYAYTEMQFPPQLFDRIVCFEGIEHVEEPKRLLSGFHNALKDDGTLLISTPNQTIINYVPAFHPGHFFHYTPEGLETDLNTTGFKVEAWRSQHNKHSLKMNEGPYGRFMLCVAVKQ